MERMQREAEELQAEGIVGVQLQERPRLGSHVIEFFAVGRSVRQQLRAESTRRWTRALPRLPAVSSTPIARRQ